MIDITNHCPICLVAFKPEDVCATDIEMGTCHAVCLEGSPVVDLDTGEETGGKIDTYPYSEVMDPAPQDHVRVDNQPRYTTKRLHEEIARARAYERSECQARITELEAALKPFAAEAEAWPVDQAPYDYRVKIMLSTKCMPSKFTAGDLRRARAALSSAPEVSE